MRIREFGRFVGHRGPNEKAIDKPTARAANDSSAMTGIGGRGAGLASIAMSRATCGAECAPALVS